MKSDLEECVANLPRETPNEKISHFATLASVLSREIIPYHLEGFTFCPRQMRCLMPNDGTDPQVFIASVRGCERRFSRAPSEQVVRTWVRDQWELLQKPGYYVGWWHDRGVFYLDVSVQICGLGVALEFARSNGQRAVFHPATCSTIQVP